MPQARRRQAAPPADSWRKSDRLQEMYARQLRAIAREVGRLADPVADDPAQAALVERAMRRYAEALEPWAKHTARRMFDRVNDQDRAMWGKVGAMMGRHLRREIENAPTGQAQADWMASQVQLITSLPIQAAERVHKLALEGQMQAIRPAELRDRILETSSVTESRAMLIARTEIARAATGLTMARAESVGSEGYIWTTARDGDVRESHRKLSGTYHRWDSPPEHEEGGGRMYRSHPGAIFNCRCYPAPVLPEF